jgi:hypothetical protein
MEELKAYYIARYNEEEFIKRLDEEGFSVSESGKVFEKPKAYQGHPPTLGHLSDSRWHGWRDDSSAYLITESRKFLKRYGRNSAKALSKLIELARDFAT